MFNPALLNLVNKAIFKVGLQTMRILFIAESFLAILTILFRKIKRIVNRLVRFGYKYHSSELLNYLFSF